LAQLGLCSLLDRQAKVIFLVPFVVDHVQTLGDNFTFIGARARFALMLSWKYD